MKQVRRVGSFTCGLSMIAFGFMFLLHTLFHTVSYRQVFAFWPFLLICMGVELLIANTKYSDTERFTLVYDKGAIALTVLVTMFAVAMGFIDFCMQYADECIHISL